MIKKSCDRGRIGDARESRADLLEEGKWAIFGAKQLGVVDFRGLSSCRGLNKVQLKFRRYSCRWPRWGKTAGREARTRRLDGDGLKGEKKAGGPVQSVGSGH